MSGEFIVLAAYTLMISFLTDHVELGLFKQYRKCNQETSCTGTIMYVTEEAAQEVT